MARERHPTQDHADDVKARARLVVLAGGQVGRQFILSEDAVLGRSPGATLPLAGEDISRRHAHIVCLPDGGYEIADLDSRNGTFVNGARITSSVIRYGDRIRLGAKTVISFSRYSAAEEQIRQRQRLETLGRLSAGLVHDFNNMIGVVQATSNFLQGLPVDTKFSDPDFAPCLEDINTAMSRAAELASRMLAFVSVDDEAQGRIDLAKVCREVVHLAERMDPSSAVLVELEAAPGLFVLGSAAEIHQVLMNLALNAFHAMPAGGRLTIATTRSELGSEQDECTISVRDTGTGMDERTLSRVFEPFFTTKRDGAGFGLGLATAQEIVTTHGGRIEVESEAGKGTEFRVVLPRDTTGRGPAVTQRMSDAPLALLPGTLVLLVDDEPAVRRSLGRVLRSAGYRVQEASSGAKALELCAEEAPDLALVDLRMPTMDGRETQRRLQALWPELPVLFISGRVDDQTAEQLRHEAGVALLRKPFGAHALVSEVARALAAALSRPDQEETLRLK